MKLGPVSTIDHLQLIQAGHTGRTDVLSGGLPFQHILPLLMNITYCEVHQNIPNFSLSLFHIFSD